MEMHAYGPGEMAPVSSVVYRVVHDPPESGERLKAFFAGEQFPPCRDCGMRVRYLLPIKVLRKMLAF